MPPITDPTLLAQIQQQQNAGMPPPQPNGLPTAPMQFPGALPALPPLRPNTVATDRTKQEMDVTSQLLPSQIAKANIDVARAQLDLRKERIAQGLDPNTGKPLVGPNAGKIGEDALTGLSEGEKNIVRGITQGRVPVSSFALARNPTLMKYIQLAYQLEPGTDLTTFQRRQAAATKFLSAPNSPMVRVNQALQHLDRFYQSAHNLDNFNEGGVANPLPQLGNYARAGAMALEKDKRYQAFVTDRDALATELAAAFQGSGQGGALADREHWREVLSAAQSPQAFDATIKEAASLLGGRAEASSYQFKQAVGVGADKFDLMSDKAKQSFLKYTDPNFGTPDASGPPEHTETTQGPDGKQLSTTYKAVPIPEGYQADHAAFMKQHPPGTLTPEQYVAERHALDQKYHDQLDGFTSTMSPEDVKNFVHDYNNGHAVTKIPALNVPLNTVHHYMAAASESTPGVAAGNFFNAATMGAPELFAGQEGRDAFHLANAEHPIAAGIGDIAGSIVPQMAVERGLVNAGNLVGRDILKTARSRLGTDAAASALYQGGRGFSDANEGEGASGAIEGAGAGALGALGGNLIAKGTKPLLSEGTRKALAALNGVDLTTFQRLGMGKAEQAITSAPFAHTAAEKAIQSLNKDNANRALSNISKDIPGVARSVPKDIEAGTNLTDFVHTQMSNAYNAVKPNINGKVDGSYKTAIAALRAQAKTPEQKAMFADVDQALKNFNQKGSYDGAGYQAASERLRALMQDFGNKAENEGSTAARDMVKIADQARQQMRAQVARNNPTVGAQLKGLERGWSHLMRIEDATNRAMGNSGVYSGDQYVASAKKLDTSGNKSLSARGKAFDQQYGLAAQRVMGTTPPRKVSLKETSVAATALGLGTAWHPYIGGAVAAIMGGAYGPGVKRVMQMALTGKRPSAIDNQIVQKALNDYLAQHLQGNMPQEGKQ